MLLLGFLRQCFVYFLKLYLATHISQTQDSFNSVVVIVVNVQSCIASYATLQLYQGTLVSNLMNHEKTWKHGRKVLPSGQTAFKDIKTSSSKSDVLKVPEFQIAVSIICHSAIRWNFVDHLGENMVTHGEGRNFMVFNNLAFFTPFGFFLDKVWLFSQKMSGNPVCRVQTLQVKPLCKCLFVGDWCHALWFFTRSSDFSLQ